MAAMSRLQESLSAEIGACRPGLPAEVGAAVRPSSARANTLKERIGVRPLRDGAIWSHIVTNYRGAHEDCNPWSGAV